MMVSVFKDQLKFETRSIAFSQCASSAFHLVDFNRQHSNVKGEFNDEERQLRLL